MSEMTSKTEARKDFDKDAAQWDASPTKVKMASEVGAAIIREVKLTKDMDVMDFGCGTGLLTLKLQPLVKSITGVDSSQGMLGVLQNKIVQQGLGNVFTRFVDFEHGKHAKGSYDLIVSSMTLHHVPDTQALFKEWAGLLRPDGQVSFADLDAEDGSFHSDNTGVFHFGFDREALKRMLHEAGFGDFSATTATVINKETKEQGVRPYPVFLVTATRRAA